MKFIFSVIIIFFLIIIQSSLYPYLQINNAFPDLILIVVLTLSILQGYKKHIVWPLIGGFFLDIFSFKNPIGASILGLLIVSCLSYFLSQNLFKKSSPISIIIIGTGGILFYRFFIDLILLISGTNFQFSLIQLTTQIAYDVVVLVPLFYLIKKFKNV